LKLQTVKTIQLFTKHQIVLKTTKTAGIARIGALAIQKGEFASSRILPIRAFTTAIMPSISASIAKITAINPRI
jgi:hypothetical protein